MNLDDLARAIRLRDAAAIRKLLFQGNPPAVRTGAGTECELWDYKEDLPDGEEGWPRVVKHVLAFHNHRGGALIFGIRDADLSFVGTSRRADSKIFNDKIRKYLGDQFWVDFHREAIQADQKYLGIAIVPPRGGMIGYFKSDAPEAAGKREFRKGESARRVGDSSIVMSRREAAGFEASISVPTIGVPFAVDEPFYRVLAFETSRFIPRRSLMKSVAAALLDSRTSVTSLIGIGGSGKTTLATWGAQQAFDSEGFEFIVSITAKDRELTTSGISRLSPGLSSYDTLLDSIAEVLGFPELKSEGIAAKERQIRALLDATRGLLYVDNLETVDDSRVVEFLDDLPVGTRALVTSRRTKVRVAVRPVDVGPLTGSEARDLVRSLETEPGLGYISNLSDAEIDRIAAACDGLPLAVRWTLARAQSAEDSVRRAEQLLATNAKDDELLEFSFRRVLDAMTPAEQAVMHALSVFQDPTPVEALVAGTGERGQHVLDSLDDLVADALAQRLFDPSRNDYVYTIAPLTRAFVYRDLSRQSGVEQSMRKRLSDWYEARDVKNREERVIVRELRQGRESPESALLDLAQSAQRRGDMTAAQELFEQALSRNPNSWKAARSYAEFERHVNRNVARALALYEQAGARAPSRGQDRALVFREWGMLLRDSGLPDATDAAIEKFEIARAETPNDPLTVHALAAMCDRKGQYRRVIELLEPLRDHPSSRTRKMALTLLLKAYDNTTEIVKAAVTRDALQRL